MGGIAARILKLIIRNDAMKEEYVDAVLVGKEWKRG
jgi:hypothetical protein